jgi:hypothetical protein
MNFSATTPQRMPPTGLRRSVRRRPNQAVIMTQLAMSNLPTCFASLARRGSPPGTVPGNSNDLAWSEDTR